MVKLPVIWEDMTLLWRHRNGTLEDPDCDTLTHWHINLSYDHYTRQQVNMYKGKPYLLLDD